MSWKLITGDNNTRRFTLSDDFIKPYETKQVPWGYGALSYFTFKRTYARLRDANDPSKGTEEWWETCRRVVEGMFTIQKKHCMANGLPWSNTKAQKTAKDAYDRLFNLKWSPPGRGIWSMGTEYLEQRTGACLFNCAFVSTGVIDPEDPADAFAWSMDALMLGVGVGFDTLGAGNLNVLKLDDAAKPVTFIIPDSREGWVASVRLLINSYLLATSPIAFDYSLVRAKGEPIKGFGGTSSGPEPLMDLHRDLRKLLDARIGKSLSSVDITDIMDYIGRCVVAGNVRRSALIAIGNPKDKAFTDMKNPELYSEELRGWRWASNNSNACVIGMDYTESAENTAKNGEPGYVWLESCRNYGRFADPPNFADTKVKGVNPCAEMTLEHKECCCLVEYYPARHEDEEDIKKTVKIAYLYSKTATLVNTHWPETNAVMLKNRRIGTSMTGVVQAIQKFGYIPFIRMADRLYNTVQELDHTYSDWLCVPRSKKTTTIKPSGTVSLLAGSTPGMHYPHSEFYIRRVRVEKDSPLLLPMRLAGYKVVPDVYSKDTMVVEFPVQEPQFLRSKEDVTMWEQLELAAQLQHWWSDNSVSVTVTFKPEEAKDIVRALDMYQTRLKTVSFLPYVDHGYELAPYQKISKEEYEALMYEVDTLNLNVVGLDGVGEKYCDGDKCIIPQPL